MLALFLCIPASCSKFSEMTIWTSQIFTPANPIHKSIFWPAQIAVLFHLWHDPFEYFRLEVTRFDWNYFRMKLIPPIKIRLESFTRQQGFIRVKGTNR
jgi:hypothetical protein